MKHERHQGQGNIGKTAESDDSEGEIRDDVVSSKSKNDESGEKQEHGEEEEEREHVDEPEDAEPVCAIGKVLVDAGMVNGCVFSLDDMEVSACPLLQKCG